MVNNMGPYSTASSTSVMAVTCSLGEAVANTSASEPSLESNTSTLDLVSTPPSTGTIVVANSPMGASSVAVGFTSSWNYVNSENSTEGFLHSAYTEANWNGQRVPVNRP